MVYQEVKYIKDSSESKCKAANIIWKVSQEARCYQKKKNYLLFGILGSHGCQGATERQKDVVNIIKQYGRLHLNFIPLLWIKSGKEEYNL